MTTRLISSLCVAFILLFASLLIPHADAAPCPAGSLATVCGEFLEGGGTGITMQSTTVVISRDGVALSPITVPASSAAGRTIQSTSISTLACQSDTYTATARSNYLVGATPFQGVVVNANPGAGLVKDRTGEPACVEAPSNFSLH